MEAWEPYAAKETCLAATPSPAVTEETLQGCTYFRGLGPLVAPRRLVGTERDHAGNRPWFSAQYAPWLLRSFFTPTGTSWRGLQHPTTWAQVPPRLGVRRTSRGALRAAAPVCDAALVPEGLTTRGAHRRPPLPLAAQEALAQVPAVDGSRVPALPRRAWAVWQDDRHGAAQMPGACAVLPQGPVAVPGTAGTAAERPEWRRRGQPGGFDVVDRGSADAHWLQEVQAAGVPHDSVLRRWGTAHPPRWLPPPCRLGLRAPGKTQTHGPPEGRVLGTNRVALDAELVALASRSRWAVERLFRWGKWVLGCRHLLRQDLNGGRIPVSAARIARLLRSLWVGRAPTKRTDAMLCCSRTGWATEAEWIAPSDRLHLKAPPPCKK